MGAIGSQPSTPAYKGDLARHQKHLLQSVPFVPLRADGSSCSCHSIWWQVLQDSGWCQFWVLTRGGFLEQTKTLTVTGGGGPQVMINTIMPRMSCCSFQHGGGLISSFSHQEAGWFSQGVIPSGELRCSSFPLWDTRQQP